MVDDFNARGFIGVSSSSGGTAQEKVSASGVDGEHDELHEHAGPIDFWEEDERGA